MFFYRYSCGSNDLEEELGKLDRSLWFLFVLIFPMVAKFKQRCFLFLVFVLLGTLITLLPDLYFISPGMAEVHPVKTIVNTPDVREIEQQGKYYYSIAQFNRAISFWQQAAEIYLQQEDSLSQARVMSNLALAYSQLNNWQEATAKVSSSLNLLGEDSSLSAGDKVPVLAQVWNNQGILELHQGKIEQAIAAWERAKINYRLVADDLGVIRASINQASAFKELGLYQRAVNSLGRIEEELARQPDSQIKATGLRNYGDMLRLVGRIERSQEVLKDSLQVTSNLNDLHEEVKTLLALGNSYKVSDSNQALEFYRRSLTTCDRDFHCLETDFPLQANLAQINLLLDSRQWQSSEELIPLIQTEFNRFPDTRVNLDRKINFAHALFKLNQQYIYNQQNNHSIPHFSAIDQFLQEIIQAAKAVNYKKAQSYSWGLRGQIAEELQNWHQAQKYSRQALILGQQLNAPEIVYLWQWQLGRVHKALGERSQAIAHYSRGVELLKSLSQDLVAIDPDVQYSFQEGVEPVYRELVSLLLTSDVGEELPRDNLERAREVIESFQLAELNNFFREACLDAQVVDIDNLDRDAAVIYPIILSDRLEIILSLPDGSLQHYTTEIEQDQLEATVEEFRQSIVIRSRRYFYKPAQELYNLLIRPISTELVDQKIKTLVFIPDGSLRNIPLGALHDGAQYLIENYSVTLTPGLQLLAPRPLKQVELKTLAVGLTKGRDGFSPLKYVDAELKEIENTFSSLVLVDQEFTRDALKQKVQYSDYPIVHIATHGQFSSSMEDTFLLAWDNRLNINNLDDILKTRNLNQEDAIELLVLSACETAAGDKRAALGLAGMAVRAGARSTLATLWSVNDLATTKLMKDFYQELSENHRGKADAVRQAQLSLLHSPGYEHPFYWASFVLLGNWL